ncbi:ANTAR domain-containing protein [Nocardioides marmoraquaticus]
MTPSHDRADTPNFARWRYLYDQERWEFSPELLVLTDVATEAPTGLDVFFAAMPIEEEREALRETMDSAVREHTSFAAQIRLTTRSRGEAVFALVADTVFDAEGRAVELRGFTTDVTEEVRVATRAAVDAATRHRRAIEQVKGALMVTYRIDEVTAFALLRQQSNAHNIKLNLLAEHVSRAMGSGLRSGQVPMMELLEGVARRLSTGAEPTQLTS